VAGEVTILRVGLVGLVGLVVGQACASARPAVLALPSPELVVPPLDGRGDAGSAQGARKGEGVSFGHPLPVPGTAWTVKVGASSESSDAQGGEQTSTYHSEYRVEILAVDGPAPSRVGLRFLRNAYIYGEREAPTAIQGKEYVVDARAPHVREAGGGAAAPESEAQRVLDVFPDLGTRTRIDEVLPDEAMRIGDARDDLAGALLRVIHPRAWSLKHGTATLARVVGEAAVFDVTLDATSESGLHLEVSGEAHVRLRDAQLVELVLDGRYESVNSGGTASSSTEPPGTFSLRRTVTSDQAPRNDR
jgi:hypothetical protein